MYELTKMMTETIAGLAIMATTVLGLNALAGACEPTPAPQSQITPQSVATPGPTGNLGQPEPQIDDEPIACTDNKGAVIPGCWIK
jgi:hypothetical protein